jgi:hypothetical protein
MSKIKQAFWDELMRQQEEETQENQDDEQND